MALTQPSIGSTNWGTSVNNNWTALDKLVAAQYVQVSRNATAQTGIVTSTDTKLEYTTEVFDAAGIFDSTTNYRATPTIAGKYLCIASVGFQNLVAGDITRSKIYKNGAEVARFSQAQGGSNTESVTVTAIVDMNGSTDYLEHFVFHNFGANRSTSASDPQVFMMIMRLSE
jgi:hypothetical protein